MAKRLLMVDDNESFTRITSRTAGLLGFTTKNCHEPDQALDAFLTFKPDVLMIDLCMPEKDGFDVANEILLTGIPVAIIFVSGFGSSYLRMAEGVAKFHAHPNVSVLGKPFRRAELAEALTKATASIADG